MNGMTMSGTVPLANDSQPGFSANSGPHHDSRPGPYPMGLMAILATVAMLFAAFTAALLVRRTGTDWVPVELPMIVWINAVVIAASSVLVEISKRTLRHGDDVYSPVWLAMGSVLGVFFLVGQWVAWRALIAQGVFLPSSPHAAFFYMLSAVHGAHVLGVWAHWPGR